MVVGLMLQLTMARVVTVVVVIGSMLQMTMTRVVAVVVMATTRVVVVVV
jgi:hypothetical protein